TTYEQSEFFQLVVNTHAPGAPTVGKMLDVVSRCPKCGSYYGYIAEHRPYFLSEDLGNVDFQVFRRLKAEGIGEFNDSGETLVISSKVLQTLLENQVRGLRQYLPNPPIEHGVAEIVS